MKSIEYANLEDLSHFVNSCEAKLFAKQIRREVTFPSNAISPWNSKKITEINEGLLSKISGSANIYAIFISEKGTKYKLVYIGQTSPKYARERLRNHLIKKHKDTGAKLNKVTEHVKNGGKIKIAWISIHPVSMRHFVEAELIKKHRKKLQWNLHGKQKA